MRGVRDGCREKDAVPVGVTITVVFRLEVLSIAFLIHEDLKRLLYTLQKLILKFRLKVSERGDVLSEARGR